MQNYVTTILSNIPLVCNSKKNKKLCTHIVEEFKMLNRKSNEENLAGR